EPREENTTPSLAAGRSPGGWGGLSRRHRVGPWIPVTPVDLVPTLAGGDIQGASGRCSIAPPVTTNGQRAASAFHGVSSSGTSHTRAVPSSLAVTTRVPSGLNAALFTTA